MVEAVTPFRESVLKTTFLGRLRPLSLHRQSCRLIACMHDTTDIAPSDHLVVCAVCSEPRRRPTTAIHPTPLSVLKTMHCVALRFHALHDTVSLMIQLPGSEDLFVQES